MKTKSRLITSALLFCASAPALAQPDHSPGGGATWIVFGGGFALGLGLGLLWCWLRCRAKKGDDKPRQ